MGGLNAQEIHDWATERVSAQRLPLPKKPSEKDPEYEFPTDPASLNNPELGQLMLRFAGWYGYAVRLMGTAESELTLIDAEFRLTVNQQGLEIRETLGRVSADVVEAAVLKEHEELGPMNKRRLELTAVKIQLEARLKIYEKMHLALSRELARREMEARVS